MAERDYTADIVQRFKHECQITASSELGFYDVKFQLNAERGDGAEWWRVLNQACITWFEVSSSSQQRSQWVSDVVQLRPIACDPTAKSGEESEPQNLVSLKYWYDWESIDTMSFDPSNQKAGHNASNESTEIEIKLGMSDDDKLQMVGLKQIQPDPEEQL